MGDYTGFERDYSEWGTLKVQMEVLSQNQAAAAARSRERRGSTPPNEEAPYYRKIDVSIPLWKPIMNGGEAPSDDRFVNCRGLNGSLDLYVEESKIRQRIPQKWPECRSAYDQDFASGTVDCFAYNDKGQVTPWPPNILAKLLNPPSELAQAQGSTGLEEQRYHAQADVWRSVITRFPAAGSPRLWQPVRWRGAPLSIYFVPSEEWVFEELASICARIRTVSGRQLSAWLNWEVKPMGSDMRVYILLSTNPLNHYKTYISGQDLGRLASAQTGRTGNNVNWSRSWPKNDRGQGRARGEFGPTATEVNDRMLTALEGSNSPYYERIKEGLKRTSTTFITSEKTEFDARIKPYEIMGGVSANQLGKYWWGVTGEWDVPAEWLHRSAVSFGPLGDNLEFQSPDNLIFGTYEANSDMTRAEAMITTMRDVVGATGILTTRVVNKNVPDADNHQLRWLDPETGKEAPWDIPPWISAANYTWIAPILIYTGYMDFGGTMGRIPWTTRYHTFSQYCPLRIEGMIDYELFKKYFVKHRLKRRTVPDRRTPGPSSLSTSAATPGRMNLTGPAEQPVRRSGASSITSAPTIFAMAHTVSSTPARHHSRSNVVVNPRTHTAWQAIYQRADHVTLGEVRIESPHLANDGNDINESTMLPPATGFMLEGTVSLFGLDGHDVALQSWHGPLPPNVKIGQDVPIYQCVKVDSLRPAEFLPLVHGTTLSGLEFQNVAITHQNYEIVKTIPIGWSISGELLIDERYGKLYEVLRNVLNISGDSLLLNILVSLGVGHSWNSRPRISTFAVQGTLQVPAHDMKNGTMPGIRLCDDVALTRIGALLFGISTPTLGLNSRDVTQYGFRIFGDMHIKVPGSVTPLDLDFEIGEFDGAVTLDAAVKGNVWKNAFGVGINLDMVRLSAAFNTSSPLQTLNCSLRAYLRAGASSALVVGNYRSRDDYSVSAYVQDLGCEGVAELYRHCTGEELSVSSPMAITLGSASIEISNTSGLTIKVDKLKFEGLDPEASALVQISSNGVQINGSVSEILLPGDLGVSLTSAYMRVSYEREGSGKSSDVSIGGKVKHTGTNKWDITADVHLYKPSSSNRLEWTVYGTFTDPNSTKTLGQLFPEVRDTFLGKFALEDLMLIAASKDDPAASYLSPQGYPIQKGVQLSARFGQITPFNKLLRRPSFPDLLLSAVWSSGDDFKLDITLPTSVLIHLGYGISTDPITLSIDLKQLLLEVNTGVKIPVPNSSIPLDFRAALMIKEESVALQGQISGLWEDPFGTSKSVSVGPFIELGSAIDLAIFFETGLPTSFSFAGGLAIGATEGQVAVNISEDPTQELLKGSVKNLGIRDLVTFARAITEVNIPMIPDFFRFEDVSLFMSTGVTLGTESYPAGFSFKANLLIFDATMDSSAEVTGGILKASGSVSEMRIGKLLVITGQNDKPATLDLEVGFATQKIEIDGAIKLLDDEIGLLLNVEIMPQPTFSFNFVLHFTGLLTFMVDARMIGNVTDLSDLSSLDFALHASFEQHLTVFIKEQIVSMLETLQHKTDEAISAASEAVAKEEERLQKHIEAAKAKQDKSYESWTQYSKKAHANSKAFIENYVKHLNALKIKVDSERRTFNLKIKDAEGAVQHARADQVAKMRAANATATQAKAKWDNDVSSAEAELERRKQYMIQNFGSAEADIEAAKRNVDSIQSQIDDANNQISQCENAQWYQFNLKAELGGLGPNLLVLQGYKTAADGVLTAAENVVQGTEYLGAQAAIPAAEELVKTVGQAGDLAYRATESTVREVARDTAAALNAANNVLVSLQRGGDTLLNATKAALDGFITAQKDSLYAAQHVADNLMHSAEWLAYQAACGGLDLASHATHILDAAKLALKAARDVTDGSIKVAEPAITNALSTFNITCIDLDSTFGRFINGSEGHFDVKVQAELGGNSFTLSLNLDMGNSVKLIDDIFHELLKKLQTV